MEARADTLKILVLDDNTIDREACRRHLIRGNSQRFIFVEHNAIDGALEIVQRENPDCILLDYHLHDGNGVEFLQQLGGIGGPRKHPVVMLTGTGNETIAVQVMKAGAQDYLVKERLSSELLQRTVETAIYKAHTERLLDEQRSEMERLFREAQEANSRKDQFLAALSHELRTPLTPVLAAITATDINTTGPDQMRDIFAIIRRNIELEARLIDDMLDLARISRGKLEVSRKRVDLHHLLNHAAQACDNDRASKHITLEWRLEAENPVAEADPARIQQVFWNLLKNALKFTPAGGRVQVSTRNVEPGTEIKITDSGIGLQSGTEACIFDAFEQGNSDITRRFGGLGLGLAISKALVEAHEGLIHARNNDGAPGATFTVVLPATFAETTFDARIPEPVPAPIVAPTIRRRVLLVEDHADSAFFLKKILEASGYDAIVAENISDALAVFRREPVDAIVSDLGLPDGKGTDLMRQVSSIRPVPAIALSGYGMESDIERSLQAGFAHHLTKPVDLEKLEATLRKLFPADSAATPPQD